MQMGTSRTSGAPNLGDFLTPLDQVALFHQYFRGMGVAANQIIAMIDLGHVAILGVILLHHQLASWAMKKGIAYSARTDEYTFARDFRPR